MSGENIKFPLMTFDDDGIMAVFAAYKEFHDSLEPQFLEEVTGVFDGQGGAYDVKVDDAGQIHIIPKVADVPLYPRLREYVHRWTELNPNSIPTMGPDLQDYLLTVVAEADLRSTPRRGRAPH